MPNADEHSTACKRSHSAFYQKKAAFIVKWPSHCRSCGALGGDYGTYDPSPSGVALSPGSMTEFDECYYCICEGKCPRCGKEIDTDKHGLACAHCDWDSTEAEMDVHGSYCVPPEPECLCTVAQALEQFEVIEPALEELAEDLENDPERKARQDEADDALLGFLGRKEYPDV